MAHKQKLISHISGGWEVQDQGIVVSGESLRPVSQPMPSSWVLMWEGVGELSWVSSIGHSMPFIRAPHS